MNIEKLVPGIVKYRGGWIVFRIRSVTTGCIDVCVLALWGTVVWSVTTCIKHYRGICRIHTHSHIERAVSTGSRGVAHHFFFF
jgi:hypothetical protein